MCTVHKLRGIPCNIHPAEPSVSCQKVKVQHGLEEDTNTLRNTVLRHFLIFSSSSAKSVSSRANLSINVRIRGSIMGG